MVNDVQEILSELQEKGWTLAAIADELGTAADTVVKWKSGVNNPALPKLVTPVLNDLLKKRPPKQRRYGGTHHLQRAKVERERESGDPTPKGQGSAGPGDKTRGTRRYWPNYHVPKSERGTSLSLWRWL